MGIKYDMYVLNILLKFHSCLLQIHLFDALSYKFHFEYFRQARKRRNSSIASNDERYRSDRKPCSKHQLLGIVLHEENNKFAD